MQPNAYKVTDESGDPWYYVAHSADEAWEAHERDGAGERDRARCSVELVPDDKVILLEDADDPRFRRRTAREWADDVKPGLLFACSSDYC